MLPSPGLFPIVKICEGGGGLSDPYFAREASTSDFIWENKIAARMIRAFPTTF
jgi:hypothetical protein